jgi:hypothetical protein
MTTFFVLKYDRLYVVQWPSPAFTPKLWDATTYKTLAEARAELAETSKKLDADFKIRIARVDVTETPQDDEP